MNLYKKNVVMPLDTEEGRLRDIGSSMRLCERASKIYSATSHRNRQSGTDMATVLYI